MRNRRIAAVITAAVMCAGAIQAFAEDGERETRGDFVYEKGTNIITQYVGETGVCEIPEGAEVIGLQKSNPEHPITKLIINSGVTFKNGLSAQANHFDNLEEAVLNEGVTEIPYQAFEGCDALEKITIPKTVTEIGDMALSNCKSLKTIELPYGLKAIGDMALCYLPSLSGDVTIPDSVTAMGNDVFMYCGDLGKVHISDNVKFQSDETASSARWFDHTKVQEINIPDSMLENPACGFSADEITFNSDMTKAIYNAVKNSPWCINKYLKGKTDKSMGGYDGFAIADDTVLRYVGADKSPVVPDGVETIGEGAFRYCDIETVTLPQSLKTIEACAFEYSTIKNITIPKNVQYMGNNALENCVYLSSVAFEGVPELDDNSVIISDVLPEENISFIKDADKLKEKIYSWGTAEDTEDVKPGFYIILNNGRERMGWDAIPVPEEYSKIDPLTGGKVKASPAPSALPREDAEASPEPTAAPSAAPPETPAPMTLTVHSGDMSVTVDGKAVEFPDAKPFLDENGRTQIPLRAFGEGIGKQVYWYEETQIICVSSVPEGVAAGGMSVWFTIGENRYRINNEYYDMDTAAMIKDDRTYIPVRYAAEALGLTVEWSE